MSKIVNATYMTLHGDITNMQNWHVPFMGEQAMAAAREQLFDHDALIMGRNPAKGSPPPGPSGPGPTTFPTG